MISAGGVLIAFFPDGPSRYHPSISPIFGLAVNIVVCSHEILFLEGLQ